MKTGVVAHVGIYKHFGQEVCGVYEQKLSLKMDSKRWSVNMASWGTRYKHIRFLPLEFYEV